VRRLARAAFPELADAGEEEGEEEEEEEEAAAAAEASGESPASIQSVKSSLAST